MCGMCGLWGQTDHWSSPARLPAAPAEASVLHRRAAQAAAVTMFTRAAGIVVRDWAQTAWVVESVSGATEIVNGLGDIWAAAERLTGQPVDPLSLALIQGFEVRQHPGRASG